jgi:hypothetical protein
MHELGVRGLDRVYRCFLFIGGLRGIFAGVCDPHHIGGVGNLPRCVWGGDFEKYPLQQPSPFANPAHAATYKPQQD